MHTYTHMHTYAHTHTHTHTHTTDTYTVHASHTHTHTRTHTTTITITHNHNHNHTCVYNFTATPSRALEFHSQHSQRAFHVLFVKAMELRLLQLFVTLFLFSVPFVT